MITLKNAKSGIIKEFRSQNKASEYLEKVQDPENFVRVNKYHTGVYEYTDNKGINMFKLAITREGSGLFIREYQVGRYSAREQKTLAILYAVSFCDNDDLIFTSDKRVIEYIGERMPSNKPLYEVIKNLVIKKNLSLCYLDSYKSETYRYLRGVQK